MFSKIDWREIVNKGCGSRRWCSLAVASRCFSTLIVPRFSTLCGVVIHTTGRSCPHFRAVCTRLECRNWWSKEWVVENFTLTSRLKTRLAARPSGRDACGARPWVKGQKNAAWLLRVLRHHERRSGTTRNRTGDTRIFSPLLYQLSYGTIFLVCGCKGSTLFVTVQLFLYFSLKKFFIPIKSATFAFAFKT